ncbi:hypothetical protein QN412_24960, partial [Pseudomonas sp. RTB3]|uniref:hypothetical protein n=1 Tax=Pseudomonas sp. RTB3 TaxID=3048633 RepID=UPI002B23102A
RNTLKGRFELNMRVVCFLVTDTGYPKADYTRIIAERHKGQLVLDNDVFADDLIFNDGKTD